MAAGTDGHVVNTISMAGLATTPFSGPYDVSKFAAMAATECLAHDLATVGAPIKVSAVCPGLVDTDIARSRRNRPSELATEQHEGGAFVEQALADGTAGSMSPDEVADARDRGGARRHLPGADPAQLRAAAHRPRRRPRRSARTAQPYLRLTSDEIESARFEIRRSVSCTMSSSSIEAAVRLADRGGLITSSSVADIPDAV